jgi:hypothetical protein
MGQHKDNVDLDVSLLDVNSEPTSHNHAAQPDDVRIADAGGPEPVPHGAVGRQLDDTPNQAADARSDVVNASTGTAARHTESLQWDGISNPNSATELVSHRVVGGPSGDHRALVAPLSPSSSLSGRYMRSNQKLVFLSSTVVALIAILIKSAQDGPGPLIKSDWDRYREDRWEY